MAISVDKIAPIIGFSLSKWAPPACPIVRQLDSGSKSWLLDTCALQTKENPNQSISMVCTGKLFFWRKCGQTHRCSLFMSEKFVTVADQAMITKIVEEGVEKR